MPFHCSLPNFKDRSFTELKLTNSASLGGLWAPGILCLHLSSAGNTRAGHTAVPGFATGDPNFSPHALLTELFSTSIMCYTPLGSLPPAARRESLANS